MDIVLTVLKYLGLGFIGLLGLLIVLALIFGKRIRRKWEYEAEFVDENGREIGEFDVTLSKIEKVEPDYTLKARFHLRHPELAQHATVRLLLDDMLVMQGTVEKAGRISLDRASLQVQLAEPRAGQRCRVEVGMQEIVSADLRRD